MPCDWHAAMFGPAEPEELIGGQKRDKGKAKAARKARKRNRQR